MSWRIPSGLSGGCCGLVWRVGAVGVWFCTNNEPRTTDNNPRQPQASQNITRGPPGGTLGGPPWGSLGRSRADHGTIMIHSWFPKQTLTSGNKDNDLYPKTMKNNPRYPTTPRGSPWGLPSYPPRVDPGPSLDRFCCICASTRWPNYKFRRLLLLSRRARKVW